MAIPTFIQNSRINQVIYQIRDGYVFVSARELLGKFKDHKVALQRLDPNYQPKITRDYVLLIVPLLLALCCGAVVWSVLNQTLIPREAAFYFCQWPAIGFAVFLAAAIRGSRRIEYYQFNNHFGVPVLSIIREREQAGECAAFITTLVAHIEMAQSDLPLEERAKLLGALEQEAPPSSLAGSGVALWKRSIALGFLASALSLLPNKEYYLAGMIFPMVYILCFCGTVCAVYSYLNKEPNRWWNLLGLVLSLIPIYVY